MKILKICEDIAKDSELASGPFLKILKILFYKRKEG
jgi:hypothetical protein